MPIQLIPSPSPVQRLPQSPLISTLPVGGVVKSGQTDYDTGTGFWLGNDAGTPKFSIGNSAANKLTWNGTTLSIVGTITATSGTIGGWTIGSTTITGGNVTLDSAGNIRAGMTSYLNGTGFWLGVTAGNAQFSVGNSSTNYMAWDNTNILLKGTLFGIGSIVISAQNQLSITSGSGNNMILTAAAATMSLVTGDITTSARTFTLTHTTGSTESLIANYNTNSSGATSHATFHARTDVGGGDPLVLWETNGGGGTSSVSGLDNSDSDKWKLCRGSTLGTNTAITVDANLNVVINNAAISTTATNGFLYVPSCAGPPTGTPTTYSGMIPIVVDSTNNKLYFYSGGAWRDAGP